MYSKIEGRSIYFLKPKEQLTYLILYQNRGAGLILHFNKIKSHEIMIFRLVYFDLVDPVWFVLCFHCLVTCVMYHNRNINIKTILFILQSRLPSMMYQISFSYFLMKSCHRTSFSTNCSY